jgi:hypothetical protein
MSWINFKRAGADYRGILLLLGVLILLYVQFVWKKGVVALAVVASGNTRDHSSLVFYSVYGLMIMTGHAELVPFA